MKYFLFVITTSFFFYSCTNKHLQIKDFQYKKGDLILQDLDCGKFCEAIEKVTKGAKGMDFSHIGIVNEKNNIYTVLEANSKGVVATNIDTFMNYCSKKYVIVGRLKKRYEKLINPALKYAQKLMNKPYDHVFDINNDSFYCSEMIYQIFYWANDKKPFFKLQPMTFIDPDKGKPFEIWVKYFEKLGVTIPEGKLGINPGGISRSKKIKLMKIYYD